MTDVWSQRADLYRVATEHAAGEDLALIARWCEAGPGVDVIDIGAGAGHTTRVLREAGCNVCAVDPAPGMHPNVVARGEDLPFADSSFDAAVSRIAAHHFTDIRAAMREMARVARRVVVEDTLYVSDEAEEAERLRDPTHVRSYSESEWRELFGEAGLALDEVAFVEKRRPFDDWLARTGCTGDDADRVRSLLSDRIVDGDYVDTKILLKGTRR